MTAPAAPCGDPYPPNRRLTCVRVPGHRGRHVWLPDDEGLASSTGSLISLLARR